jgi:hypothetical protein
LLLPPPHRAKVIWRLDGGFGGDDNVDWLLARNYQVLVKGHSNRRAAKLAQQVKRWLPVRTDKAVGRVQTPVSGESRPPSFASEPDTDVLLGQAYFLRFDPKLWAAQQPYAPLGSLYAAAYVRAHGYEVAFFDAMLATSEAEQQVSSQPPTKKEKQADQQEQFLKTTASDPRLVHLQNQIGKTKGVKDVSPSVVDNSGSAASFSVIPTTAPSADATTDLVNHLRDSVIPKADKGTTLTTYVGGQTASYIDLASRISEKLPLVIAVVIVIASFASKLTSSQGESAAPL